MGRRASKRKPPPKKRNGGLAKKFDCPWCNHELACDVTINHEKKIGVIKCRICGEEFQTKTTYLTEEIDVYTDWIDACEEANQ